MLHSPRPAGSYVHAHPPLYSYSAQTPRSIENLNGLGFLPMEFRPVERDASDVRFDGIARGSLRIWRTRSRQGFVTIPKVRVPVFSIRIPKRGNMRRRDVRGEFSLGRGYGLLLPYDEMKDLTSSDNFDVLSCTVDSGAILDVHATMSDGAPDPLDFEPLVELKTMPLRVLAQTINRVYNWLLSSAPDHDLTYPLLEEMLICQILTAWPRRPVVEPPRILATHSRHIFQAIQYIDAHISRPIYVTEIARAVGVNTRTLQMSFRTELGMSPVQYILDQRLQRVHADLLNQENGDYVSQIAYRWGFANLGDFNRRYRARFGCPPSHTMRGERRRG